MSKTGTGDVRYTRLWDFDHVHVEDIATRTGAHIRGLDYITINYNKAEARIRGDIQFNIAMRETGGINGA
jgi:hypothetical protein